MPYSELEFWKLKVKSAKFALRLAKRNEFDTTQQITDLRAAQKGLDDYERKTSVLRRSEGKKGQRIGGIDV